MRFLQDASCSPPEMPPVNPNDDATRLGLDGENDLPLKSQFSPLSVIHSEFRFITTLTNEK